jgi:hypothetical protein
VRSTFLIAFGSALLLAAQAAVAGDIYLIANSSLQLTPDEGRDVYLGEKQLAGSVKIVPFENSAAQADFLSKVLQMDAGKYSTLWTKKGFREGLNPPAVRGSDLEVLASVKANPGGVGYVTSPPTGVTIIRKY